MLRYPNCAYWLAPQVLNYRFRGEAMGTLNSSADTEDAARALADYSDDLSRAIASVFLFEAPEADRRSGQERRVNQLSFIGQERRSGQERRLPAKERLRRLQKELREVAGRSAQLSEMRRLRRK